MANEVAVLNDNERNIMLQVGGTLFSDIDFNSLDRIIDDIGRFSEKIDDNTREAAEEYINKWEKLVCRRLVDKQYKLRNFNEELSSNQVKSLSEIITFLRNQPLMNFIESVVPAYLPSLEEINADIQEFEFFKEEKYPMKEFVDNDNITPAEVAIMRTEYETSLQKYRNMCHTKEFAIRKKFHTFKIKFDKDSEVKKFRVQLNKQVKNAGDAVAVVEEKAALARMNMVIPDANIRKLLMELNDFQREL